MKLFLNAWSLSPDFWLSSFRRIPREGFVGVEFKWRAIEEIKRVELTEDVKGWKFGCVLAGCV